MLYRILRTFFRYALSIYFRKIEAEHLERIPDHEPALIVANHCNAFVDALVIMVALERPVILTAKSTLRKNPVLRFLIDWLGVIELHRRQDVDEGAEPSRNVDQFAKIRRRLQDGDLVCLFPEGFSHSQPRLQGFRTGAARVALADLPDPHDEGCGGDLQVVPLGLHYEAKAKPRSSVWIRVGEPFSVREWLRESGRNQSHAARVKALTGEMERRVHDLVLSYERRREALLVDWAAEVVMTCGTEPTMLGRDVSTWPSKVRLMDSLAEGLENIGDADGADVGSLVHRLREYRLQLKRLGIEAGEVFLSRNPLRALFFVIRELELIFFGLPLMAIATLQHLLPYLCTRAFTHAMSRDPDHWASNAVFGGMVLWPLLLGIETLVVGWWTGWWIAGIFLGVSPFTLYYAALYVERWNAMATRTVAFTKLVFYSRLKRSLQTEAMAITDEIRRLGEIAGVEERR